MTQKELNILFMQSDMIFKYSRFAKISYKECVMLFNKYNIYGYIRDCYELLELYPSQVVAKYIDNVIKRGERYGSRNSV